MPRKLVRSLVWMTSFAVALPPPGASAQPVATATIPAATVTQTADEVPR